MSKQCCNISSASSGNHVCSLPKRHAGRHEAIKDGFRFTWEWSSHRTCAIIATAVAPPPPKHQHSILAHPMRCPKCSWRGPVGACEPDVDGDGSLGCPQCETVVVLERFLKFRSDGWPLCPRCGEDELSSSVMLAWLGDGARPTLHDCFAGRFGCLNCGVKDL